MPDWSAGAIRAADGNLVVDGVQPHAGLAPSDQPNVRYRVPRAGEHDRAGRRPRRRGQADRAPRQAGGRAEAGRDPQAGRRHPRIAGWLQRRRRLDRRRGGRHHAVRQLRDRGRARQALGRRGATKLFTQLHSLIAIGTAGSGTPLKDETYGDATITTVDLTALAPMLAGMAGGSSSGTSPLSGLGSALPGKLMLSYAVTDQVVVLSLDIAFVKAVLDARTGDLAREGRTVLGRSPARSAPGTRACPGSTSRPSAASSRRTCPPMPAPSTTPTSSPTSRRSMH